MTDAIQVAPTGLVGPAAIRLAANGWDPRVLRTLDLLRKDEWKAIDDAVVEVARRQLGAVDDLRSAGLTRDLGGLGVLLDEYEKVSDVEAAEQSMSGVTSGSRDLATFELGSVPVPITFRDFQINLRHLEASRRGRSQIDVTNADLCARRVNEKLEDMLFNGSTIAISGNTLAGYTTVSSRITGSLTGSGWDDSGSRDIIADTIAMISAAEAQNFFGPFMVYVPVAYNAELRADHKANSDKTYLDRILEIDAIQGVRGTASLTGDAVVMVQLTRDVVDLSVGQDLTTVQWDTNGGFSVNFKVMAAIAPRVKSPHGSNKTGIVHYT